MYKHFFKRAIDLLLSFIGIIVLTPVWLILTIAIFINDPGPIFFTQKRVGKKKKLFKILKFRTMKTSTPHDMPTHMLENPEQYITKVGGFLRKTSLDELPQIFNIFAGQMSIIGPRPALWNQDDLIAERDKCGANDVKPGLTGWAQINGRDELEIPVKAKLDGEYVEKMSFGFDCKCFFGTIKSVLKHDGVVEGGTGELHKEALAAEEKEAEEGKKSEEEKEAEEGKKLEEEKKDKQDKQDIQSAEVAATQVGSNALKIEEVEPNYDAILVSVVVPTYKQTKLLYKAVQSITDQSHSNLEIIVIDDNVDKSYSEKNAEYFKSLNDGRIVYAKNAENLGAAQSRNKAIFMSHGEYITFLDDDDYIAFNKIDKQLRDMVEKNLDASVCNLILKNDDGKIVDKRQRKYFNGGESLLSMHLKYHITGTDTMMFRADFLKRIGGFDKQDFGDEFLLMLKTIENTDKIGHLDFDGAYATIHRVSGISSYANKKKIEEDMLKVKSRYFPKLKKKDVRFIKMRHYAVLAVACKKGKKPFGCMGNLIKAFFTSPSGFIKLYSGDCR